MNEIAAQKIQLPDNIENLSKFVLVGRKKIELERQRVLGQLSLDDVHNKN